LGKASQGISTALAVEKTSKRGGKIVNASADIGKSIFYGKQNMISLCPSNILLCKNVVML